MRSKRNTVSIRTAKVWQYAATVAGVDAMPYHGDCKSPLTHEVRGVGSRLNTRLAYLASDDAPDSAEGYGFLGHYDAKEPATTTAYVSVRCRRCDACLEYRRRLWTARAIAETRLSSRTWFVTLTYGPESRFLVKAAAEARVVRTRCEQWSMLTTDERFRHLVKVANEDVTKFLKRIRKNSGARLRYILVSEAHADGFPHFHLLIHEGDNGSLSKRISTSAWTRGHSHMRLVDTGDAKATGYVCKYLSKSATTRVRASRKYGRPSLAELDGAVRMVLDTLPRRLTES